MKSNCFRLVSTVSTSSHQRLVSFFVTPTLGVIPAIDSRFITVQCGEGRECRVYGGLWKHRLCLLQFRYFPVTPLSLSLSLKQDNYHQQHHHHILPFSSIPFHLYHHHHCSHHTRISPLFQVIITTIIITFLWVSLSITIIIITYFGHHYHHHRYISPLSGNHHHHHHHHLEGWIIKIHHNFYIFLYFFM